MQSELDNEINGEYVARYFKYYLQQKNKYVIYKLPLMKVQPKSLYSKYKKQFDAVARICNTYGISVEKYTYFFVIVCNKFEANITYEFCQASTIIRYAEYLKIKQKQQRIYKMFLNSAKNIVADCIQLRYNNVIDYLRYLIDKRMLASYYLAGKISTYYFAAIPNFKKVIEKLDNVSKDEFRMLYDRYDTYNADVIETFLVIKNIRINPLKYTNDMLLKARKV